MVDQIVSVVQSGIKKLPDLEKYFPTEESRYSAYIKLLYITLVCGMLGRVVTYMSRPTVHMVGYRKVVEEPSAMTTILSSVLGWGLFVSSICLIYAILYVYVKSGTLQFFIRLVVGILAGSAIMMLLSLILGPIAPLLTVIVAVIANRKRLAVLRKYKSFVWYGLGAIIVPVACFIVGLLIAGIGSYLKSSIANLGFLLLLLGFVMPTLITHYALRRESARGRNFYETIRLLNVVPFVCLCCFISYLTLTHIGGLSGDSVFGASGTDFLADTGVNAGVNNSDFGMGSMSDAAGTVNAEGNFAFTNSAGNMSGAAGAVNTEGNFAFTQADSSMSGAAGAMNTDPMATASAVNGSTASMPGNDFGVNTQGVAFEPASHATINDAMGDTVLHAKTDSVTGETVFQNNMSQTIGTTTVDPATGGATFHDASGQAVSSVTRDGAILNQLGLSDGHISWLDNGDMLVFDDQNHLVETIKSDGTILDPLQQKIGEIKL